MAQVVLELVSFATSAGLGIAQILIPSDSGAAIDQLALGNSRVRLGFGFNPNRKVINDTMGGRVPSIRVYNDHAKRIGMASSPIDSIAVAGQWIDITVVQDVKFQQPTFLEVDAMDKDLVCLAYIGQTWSDGTKLGWLGDIGRFCGTAWYHSALYVSKADGGLYTPSCTWVGHGTFNLDGEKIMNNVTAIQMHMTDFGKQSDSGAFSVPADASSLCRPPAMTFGAEFGNKSRFNSPGSHLRPTVLLTMFEFFGMIVGAKASALKYVQGFDNPPQIKTAFGGALISSHHAQHGGRALCADSSSVGPDFVSFSESTFCDMETKTLWPLCNSDNGLRRGCFDWHTKTLIMNWFGKRTLKYREVIEWGVERL